MGTMTTGFIIPFSYTDQVLLNFWSGIFHRLYFFRLRKGTSP